MKSRDIKNEKTKRKLARENLKSQMKKAVKKTRQHKIC